MSRIRRGWQLTKKSWSILRSNPSLIRFPIYGGVLASLVTIVSVGPGLYLIEEELEGFGIALAVIGIYLATLVGYFFSVGLAASANAMLQGGEDEGMAVARSRFAQIAGWAAIATIVALIINAIQERAGFLGAIFGSILSIGWALISFMAVPVIAIEGCGPFATLKRSASIFRQRWGQQVTGNVAIGGIALLAGVLPAIALIGGGIAIWASSGFAGAVLVVLGACLLIVALLIQRAMSVIFGVALYHYALEGAAVGGFTSEEIESAVRLKGGISTSHSTV